MASLAPSLVKVGIGVEEGWQKKSIEGGGFLGLSIYYIINVLGEGVGQNMSVDDSNWGGEML